MRWCRFRSGAFRPRRRGGTRWFTHNTSAAAELLRAATSARAVSRFCSESDAAIAPQGSGGRWRNSLICSTLTGRRSTHARRRTLSRGLLPESVWIDICLSSGISPGAPVVGAGRCWLRTHHGFQEPGALGRRPAGVPLQAADLPELLNSEFISAADSYAGHFLAEPGHRWRAGGLHPRCS